MFSHLIFFLDLGLRDRQSTTYITSILLTCKKSI
jgi:hypothetical protein